MSLGTACSDDVGPLTATTPTTATATEGDPTDGDPTADEPTTGGLDTTSTGASGDDDAWMTPYCYTVADSKWIAAWIEREQEVLELVNAARAAGGSCGTMGSFEPSGPLTIEARLHCAARKHSQDMAERNFFDHVNPDGEDPFQRMARAGYSNYAAAGENIAAGSDDPALTVQGWLDSDGHCSQILNPQYREFGIGFYEGAGSLTYYWTQTFGAPFN